MKPCFHIIFTVSYGLSREQLEELNFLIKNSDPVDHSLAITVSELELLHSVALSLLQDASDLSYTFNVNQGLARPSVMLKHPLLAEVYGAGFTKAPGSKVR